MFGFRFSFFPEFYEFWLKKSFSMTLAFLVAKTAVSLASYWSVWPSWSNINKMWLLFSKSCPFDIPNPYTRLNGNRIWFCFTVVNPPLSLGKKHQPCEKWKTFKVTFTSSLASPLDCCRERSRFIKTRCFICVQSMFSRLSWCIVLYGWLQTKYLWW